ncbi:ATP-dependent helicase [Methylosinus sp. KRF6]|uniref:ATP-dependent helicase n=1 Tax=Methylosinus sp. KRF6 TaxID=2846853 RepID=UPI00209AC23F|nr:ATP-dependent helicase [Methylosinus sp. KRF6]
MSRYSDIDPLAGMEEWDRFEPCFDEPPAEHIPSADAFDRMAVTLTSEQARAAAHTGPILVLAGAGTGKTSTLTAAVVHRIAVERIPASRILAVTFTNKAAAEMASRIRAALDGHAAPSWLGTYHGLAARQLRDAPEIAELRPDFDIVDADDCRRFVKRVMKAQGLGGEEGGDGTARNPLKIMCNRIAKFKDNLITPAGAAAWVEAKIAKSDRSREPIDPHALRAAVRVYADYQRALREANAADFGDLLLWPTLAMRKDDAYRARWASRFDWLAADEYQDVNFAQYSWLKHFAAEHGRVFCVGDDDQAIYGWRGSDIEYIRRFQQDFPNAERVRLEENFRSTGHILAAANAVIARDRKRLGKTLYTRKEAGDRIEIVAYRDAQAEAAGVVEEILTRHAEGTGWQEIAILYRSSFLSRGFEEALMRARIPHVIVGDVGFYQRAEVKDALALLRLAATPDDRQSDEAFRRVINEPRRGFGAKAMQAVETEASFRNVSLLRALDTAELPAKCRAAGLLFADQLRRIGEDRSHTLADQISLLLDASGYRTMLRDSKAESSEDRLQNLQELIALAGEVHTARELLDHAALATSRPGEDETDRVRLMTLHKAKGLEFPHVFLPAWEAGVFPSDYGDADEERRLAYVALTRGMRRVSISYCGFRRGFGAPSLFVDDVPDEHSVRGRLRDAERRRGTPRQPIDWRKLPSHLRRP